MHPGMSQAAQLRVELGEELAARALVAAIRRGEQPGDITHPTSEGRAVVDRNDRGRRLYRIRPQRALVWERAKLNTDGTREQGQIRNLDLEFGT